MFPSEDLGLPSCGTGGLGSVQVNCPTLCRIMSSLRGSSRTDALTSPKYIREVQIAMAIA